MTFQLQRGHGEKSLPGRGAAGTHVGTGAGSASCGCRGVGSDPWSLQAGFELPKGAGRRGEAVEAPVFDGV